MEKSLLDYGEEDEAYLYLDPKLRERADPAAARSRGPPREVIVFMIGGGCYSEYQNLQVRREEPVVNRCTCMWMNGNNCRLSVGDLPSTRVF